mmetsp:Transcript_17549/g.29611  ORF Transcript_17549/g.29611 Transcript_17549/m.29611 type:complete len:264 (+) Transcript_17549:241-1032(+)
MEDLGSAYQPVYYQQRLVPGEVLMDEATLKRYFESDAINSQYIQAIFCEEYEKNMLEEVMQKQVMNGSVVPLESRKEHDRIRAKAAKLVKVFYKGDDLTPLEVDIERMYVSEKLDKHTSYKQRASIRYKVRWTLDDFNRFQDQTNYRMNDMDYFGSIKPYFLPFDLDKALECMYVHQDIQKTNRLRRFLTYFTDTKVFERGTRRSQMQATTLLQRSLMYIDSWEFVNSLDIPNDFHVNHAIANMHVWLLYQRLRDFAENKFAF